MLKNYLSLVLIFTFLSPVAYAQTVTIPDPNFEQALIDLGIDSDGIINQTISYLDAQYVSSLDVSSRNIIDLTGLGSFQNLTYLNCSKNDIESFPFTELTTPNLRTLNISENKITSLTLHENSKLSNIDVSNNPNLTYLNAKTSDIRPITRLNASNNPALKTITCINSILQNIDISGCPALEELYLQSNTLTTIDLSNNINLKILNLENNQLNILDLSAQTKLTTLNVSGNSLLKDLDCSNNELTFLSAYITELNSLNCSNNQLSSIGSIETDALLTLNLSNNLFSNLEINASLLTSLDISGNPLTELTIRNAKNLSYLDLSTCITLKSFYCFNITDKMPLTNLDLSQNTVLETLVIDNTGLTSLNLDKNLNIKSLYLNNNPLSDLDLRKNVNLKSINLDSNQLSALDVRNGTNALITSFYATNNPDLTCIFVDNAIAANAAESPYINWEKDFNIYYRKESCYFDIQIIADKFVIAENGEVAIVTATLNEVSPSSDVIITLAKSGTAPSSNYNLSSNTIVIPAGQLSDSVTLTALEDTMDTDKTVILDVISVENADILTRESLTFTIKHINDAPNDISLQTASFEENTQLQDMTVIIVSDIDDAFHTLSLVAGVGSDDNISFSITDNVLSTNLVFDYEMKKDYFIRIKAEDAEGLFIEKALVISVINLNDMAISGNIVNTYCGSDTIGAIQTTITEFISPLNFSWSSGDITQNISNKPSGFYTLTVTDGEGMVIAKDFEIKTESIYSHLNICFVTSDAIDSDYNRIFINNTAGYNIEKVEILREGSVFGQYDLIGEMNPDEASYLDTTSNNQIVSYNYKVRVKDKCGNISESSALHQTMLLQANRASDGSINLNWSPYFGLSYGTYDIYRKENNSDFQLLTSLSSNKLAYNDKDVNSNTKSYDYFIGIAVSDPCDFTPFAKATKSNLDSDLIKSNFKSFSAALSTNDAIMTSSISIYPNPVRDVFTIDSKIGLLKIELYSLLGMKVKEATTGFKSININNLPNGIYIIKLATEKGITTKKIVKK